MATLKEVELKIKGVKKTKQITKAMNMVAASRLRGAQTNMEAFRPYAAKFAEVLGSLAETSSSGEEISPLLVPKENPKKTNIVLCTSDRGLCGGFNSGLVEKAKSLAAEKQAQGMEVSFTCFGKNGFRWAKKGRREILASHIGVVGSSFGFKCCGQCRTNTGQWISRRQIRTRCTWFMQILSAWQNRNQWQNSCCLFRLLKRWRRR